MKETRPERFKRLAEARVNKLIAMIRLLGNLSNSLIYEYRPDQVTQIFSALQTELNRARNRFYQNRGERVRFSLSDISTESLAEEHEPKFEIRLPDGTLLRAVGFEEDTYPGVCIYVCSPGNREKSSVLSSITRIETRDTASVSGLIRANMTTLFITSPLRQKGQTMNDPMILQTLRIELRDAAVWLSRKAFRSAGAGNHLRGICG